MDVKPALRCTERLPKHLGGQTAAAHPHQHGVREAFRDQLGPQVVQLRHAFLHPVGHLEPAEPVANLLLDCPVRLPERGVLLGDPPDDGSLLELGQAPVDRAVDGAQVRVVGTNLAGSQLLLFVCDLFQQLRDRVREQLDTVHLKVISDFVHVDADGGQLAHHLLGAGQFLEQTGTDLAMLFEGHHGLLGHGVDRLWADQLLDVHHVAVVRVFGSGAGPETSLDPGVLAAQRLKFRLVEDSLERLVGQLRVRDSRLAEQILEPLALGRVAGGGDLLFQQFVDRGVDPADEEAGHRGDVDGLPRLRPPLKATDIGARDILVDLDREHQRDVDIQPVGDALLDGRESLIGCGNLHEDIRPPYTFPKIVGHRDRGLCVVRHPRKDFDADVAVLMLRLVVDGLQHVGGHLDVLDDEAQHDFLVRRVVAVDQVP